MTPTHRPLAQRVALFINRHADGIAAATGLVIFIAMLVITTPASAAGPCHERPTPTTTHTIKNAKLEQPHRPSARPKPQHRIGTLIAATRWTPSIWVGTDWQDGACP